MCALAFGCSSNTDDDGGGGTPQPDASVPIDSGVDIPGMDASNVDPPDAGFRDALPPDTGPDYDFGLKLADSPVDVIAVTPDESEIIYIKRIDFTDRLFAISPAGGEPRQIAAAPVYTVFTETDPARLGIVTTRNTMWVMTNQLRVVGMTGILRTYEPGGFLQAVTGTSAKDVVSVSPTAEWAIATDDFQADRTVTATFTADIVLVNADGSENVQLLDDANMGIWDRQNNEFSGRCETAIAWTSTRTAALVACPGDTKIPTLFHVDLDTRSATMIEEGVSRFLQVNPAHTFFFWADDEGRIFASPPDQSQRLRMVDSSTIAAIRFLDERRFAFNNLEDELKVSSYPTLTSTTIFDFAVEELRRASPTGNFVLFSQSDDFIADMRMISTATPSENRVINLEDRGQAYPGDDAFSPDGTRVYWYQRTNPNLIGDITTRLVDRNQDVLLTPQAYWVFNYADPTRVVLMVNARARSQNRIICDLATRAIDGSDEVNALAGDLVCQPRDFVVFPQTNRIVYHVTDGPFAGMWIRDLE